MRSIHNVEFDSMIVQLLPITLVILYILFPKPFRMVSIHPLGKCVAILLICLYSNQDKIHGLLICLLVILYYQLQDQIKKETFLSKTNANYSDFLPTSAIKTKSAEWEARGEDNDGVSIDDAYPTNLEPIVKSKEQIFRNTHCTKDAKMIKNNQIIKNAYVQHVYPDLHLKEDHCNPCDPTCHFTVMDKQKVETQLSPTETRGGGIVWSTVEAIFTGSQPKEPPVIIMEDMVVSEYK